MKSIFRYPGGKTKKSVREKLFAHMPADYKEYREPFVGGGGIFFSVPTNKKRWINDVNPDLMSVYVALKCQPDYFISSCRKIQPPQENEELTSAVKGKKLYNARLKQEFDRLVEDREKYPALSYFFVNRTVWMGRVNYDIPSRLYFSNPTGWNVTETEALEQARDCLKDVRISCANYAQLFEEDGEDVIIYADPPYYVQTNTAASSQLYQYCFTKEDHVRLHDVIKGCKHKVCLSYDNDDEGFITKLFGDMNIIEDQWTYCGTSSSDGHSKKKRQGKELIITNY